MRSCSQSQSVFPGNPVPYTLISTVINTIATIRIIAIRIGTQCSFIHHERFGSIVSPLAKPQLCWLSGLISPIKIISPGLSFSDDQKHLCHRLHLFGLVRRRDSRPHRADEGGGRKGTQARSAAQGKSPSVPI